MHKRGWQEQYAKKGGDTAYLDAVESSSQEDTRHTAPEEAKRTGQTRIASDILDNAFVIVEFENGSRALLDLCMFAETSYYQAGNPKPYYESNNATMSVPNTLLPSP